MIINGKWHQLQLGDNCDIWKADKFYMFHHACWVLEDLGGSGDNSDIWKADKLYMLHMLAGAWRILEVLVPSRLLGLGGSGCWVLEDLGGSGSWFY